MTPEYEVEVPIGGVNWVDLGLDPLLLDRLADWQQVFDDNFQARRGHPWKTVEVRDRWVADAQESAAELRATLNGVADLEVDLWSVE